MLARRASSDSSEARKPKRLVSRSTASWPDSMSLRRMPLHGLGRKVGQRREIEIDGPTDMKCQDLTEQVPIDLLLSLFE